jgi:hypothetical protein
MMNGVGVYKVVIVGKPAVSINASVRFGRKIGRALPYQSMQDATQESSRD